MTKTAQKSSSTSAVIIISAVTLNSETATNQRKKTSPSALTGSAENPAIKTAMTAGAITRLRKNPASTASMNDA